MKILVFTEGTVLMHALAGGVSREDRVKQSQAAGIQREERNIAFESNTVVSKAAPGSVYDLESYIPVGNAVEKLNQWKQQGVEIVYLTSRRIKLEVETIKKVLQKYHFPDSQNLYFRQQGEDYKDIAERIMPDILIEDDCESIGGEKEMVYPHIKEELKPKIKSIVVKEFEGIDHLSTKEINIKKHIAMCGLDCSICNAFIATKNNDALLRKKTAKEWNERYRKDNRGRSPIKPEDINCNGCLSDGPIYLYCQRCKIRSCGFEKEIKNCKECKDYRCEDLIELQKHFF